MDRAFRARDGISSAGSGAIFKRIFGLLFFIVICSLSVLAQITTVTNGAWIAGNIWSGGTVPTITDDATVNNAVTIASGTTVEINNLTIESNGNLTVEGTLIVYGNLTMVNNDPELTTGSESSIFIFGNAFIANKVNINLSSYFITLGDFTISGGGATDIEIDDASIYVFGDFDGGTSNLEICDDYDNYTADKYDSCHIGTVIAFEDNVDDNLIPPEILELINPCSTIDVFISEPAVICNAADGVVNDSTSVVTTEVFFIVNMLIVDGNHNSTWEFSFRLSYATGATLFNVSDGTNLLVDDMGIYTLTDLTSHSGAGAVTISMDVTGDKYIEELVTMEITSARELKCNTPAADESRWKAEQVINAIPETSEINTN